MNNKILEILNSKFTKLYDNKNPKRPIFFIEKKNNNNKYRKYKNLIEKLAEESLDKEGPFNEDFGKNGVKETEKGFYFQLLSSNRRKLGFLYYNNIEEFLKENGIKDIEKIKNKIFIYSEKNHMNNFIKAYEFYNEIKEFLINMKSSYYDEFKKIIVLFYNDLILIEENINKINYQNFEKNNEILKILKEKYKKNKEKFSQHFKKVIYELFKTKKENEGKENIKISFNEIADNLESIYKNLIEEMNSTIRESYGFPL